MEEKKNSGNVAQWIARTWRRKIRFFWFTFLLQVCFIFSNSDVRFHGLEEVFPSMLCDMPTHYFLVQMTEDHILNATEFPGSIPGSAGINID